jgi:hypothetical protein
LAERRRPASNLHRMQVDHFFKTTRNVQVGNVRFWSKPATER